MNNKKTSSTTKKITNVYSVSIENLNQKSNQLIIEEIDEENIENNESDLVEKVECKNVNVDECRNGFNNNNNNKITSRALISGIVGPKPLTDKIRINKNNYRNKTTADSSSPITSPFSTAYNNTNKNMSNGNLYVNNNFLSNGNNTNGNNLILLSEDY